MRARTFSVAAPSVAVFVFVLVLGIVAAASPDAAAEVGDAGPTRDAGTTREAGTPISRTPPDPPAMSVREQWVFDLRWERGEVYLLGVHKIDMGAPHSSPRVMGRFALELFEGPTLIERVRFDFPMLGTPEGSDAGMRTAPRFEPKLKTRIGVVFPATPRGTKLELWDRALDVRVALPWPPKEGPVASDAGSAF